MEMRLFLPLFLCSVLSLSACSTAFKNPPPADKEHPAHPELEGAWDLVTVDGKSPDKSSIKDKLVVEIKTKENAPWDVAIYSEGPSEEGEGERSECLARPTTLKGAVFLSFECSDKKETLDRQFIASYMLQEDTLRVLQLDPKAVLKAIEAGKLKGEPQNYGPTAVDDSAEKVLEFMGSAMEDGWLVEFAVLKRKP